MNIDNIKSLQRQLTHLGFESLGGILVKKICFKPDNFFLFYEILIGNNQLYISLYIEKELNTYAIKYYDAAILKEILFQNTNICGVDTAALEKRMLLVDWRNLGESDDSKLQSVESKEDWKNETMIESIVEDLQKLDSEAEGKKMALNFKLKFWSGIKFLEELGNVRPLKNNQEVNQRFYFYPKQTGITIDEAHRFLKNMYMEKYFKLQKRQDRGDASNKSKGKLKKSTSLKKHKINSPVSKEISES